MKFGMIVLASLLIASAFALDCPFGMVNDTYPGDCGKYIDQGNDSICDLSQEEIAEQNSSELNKICKQDFRNLSIIEISKRYGIMEGALASRFLVSAMDYNRPVDEIGVDLVAMRDAIIELSPLNLVHVETGTGEHFAENKTQPAKESEEGKTESTGLGNMKLYFIGHAVTGIISAILIIYLGLQFRMKQAKFHKEIAYAMAITGVASLVFSYLFGINISLTLQGIHNIIGFVSLGLSLLPILFVFNKWKIHCLLGDAAAVFAALSIIGGIAAYWDMIFIMIR